MTTPIRIRDIMQTKLLCLNPDTEINAALRQLLARNISGAPVVDEDRNLIGVLSVKISAVSGFGSPDKSFAIIIIVKYSQRNISLGKNMEVNNIA